MRPISLLICCLLLVATTAAFSQTTGSTGKSLSERIFRPDYSKQYKFGSSVQRKSQADKKRGAQTKEFHYINKVRNKKARTGKYKADNFYSGKSKFGGTKTKNFHYVTNNKLAPTHRIPNAGRKVATDTYRTSAARDAGKSASTRNYTNVKQTTVRGTAQGSIDQQYSSDPMSLDQVRSLLNRGK